MLNQLQLKLKTIINDREFNFLEFLALLALTAALAGIFYWYQTPYLTHWEPWAYVAFRATRMTLIYVIFPLIYAKHKGLSPKKWGITFPRNIESVLLGMGVYGIALAVFWRYRIFFDSWAGADLATLLTVIPFVCIMAAITDFWTRGFVLLTLSDRYGWLVGIITQNVFWFILHYYEILLLEPYISFWGGVALTLILGLLGDMVTLHYRNIWGLMIGHSLLNIMVAGLASNWYGLA